MRARIFHSVLKPGMATAAGLMIASGIGSGAILPRSARADAPTFTRDVAPIFFENCTMCHRPGEVAPMSLMSYAEARPWAKSVANSVRERDMPPWSGESEHHEWRDSLKLTDDEIATIIAWAQAGAREGDPSDLPPAPKYPEGWTLGEPDYIIELEPVEVPASGEDLFLKETITADFGEDKWVTAIEFLPGDRRAAHHMQTTYRSTSKSGKSRGSESAIGGILAIWTAGMSPFVFPEGVGRPLGSSIRILVDSHYHPYGEATVDRTRIGLHFGKGEMKKEVATLAVTNTGIRIPPGASAHEDVTFNLLDRDMEILAFSPHLHVRGKAMRYDLVHPDGRRETLLDVPKYNYNWQWQYYPTEPIPAPAGSRIEVTGVWDNSEDNPHNPDPGKEIRYRGDTFNEMFVGFVEVIPAEGVMHKSDPQDEKMRRLLAAHPAEDCYVVNNGFIPFGMYVPKQGQGWLYISQGVNMFSIRIDDVAWEGDKVKVIVQLPTPEASATESHIEATRGADGTLKGYFSYGVDSPRKMRLPLVATPATAE